VLFLEEEDCERLNMKSKNREAGREMKNKKLRDEEDGIPSF